RGGGCRGRGLGCMASDDLVALRVGGGNLVAPSTRQSDCGTAEESVNIEITFRGDGAAQWEIGELRGHRRIRIRAGGTNEKRVRARNGRGDIGSERAALLAEAREEFATVIKSLQRKRHIVAHLLLRVGHDIDALRPW